MTRYRHKSGQDKSDSILDKRYNIESGERSMLLKGYEKEMFRPKCNPNFQSVHCVAHLDQDISEVLPYLNAALGADDYVKSPPALTLRTHGKLITLHARAIFVNALKDDEEADKILKWLQGEINEAWEKRGEIQPKFEARPAAKMLEILKLLPRTNCGKCDEPTCTVFSVQATQGVRNQDDCPELTHENKTKLREYLSRFDF
jgi:ArsR family metal-binding transcriptional regulator